MSKNGTKWYIYEFVLIIVMILVGPLGVCMSNSGHTLQEKFLIAAEKGDIVLVESILDRGVNINYAPEDGYTALSIATQSGNISLVKLLLKHNANPEGNDNYPNAPVYFAIVNNHPEVIEILIESGVNPNYAWSKTEGGTLLTNAAQFGLIEVVTLLVNRGADVNFTGYGEFSALYRSIIYDHLSVAVYLVNNGAKLNENDKKALKQLGWFKEKENEDMILLMKEKGAL